MNKNFIDPSQGHSECPTWLFITDEILNLIFLDIHQFSLEPNWQYLITYFLLTHLCLYGQQGGNNLKNVRKYEV